MRIGVDATSVLDELTGAEAHALTAVEALAAAGGHEVVPFVRRRPPQRWEGLDAVRPVVLATGSQAAATQVLLPRAARRAGVDVLYCPAKPAPAGATVPVLAAVHDLVPWTRPETMGRAAAPWYRAFHRIAVRRGHHVSTGLECVAGEVRARLGVPAERLHVVGHALVPWLERDVPRPAVAGDGPFVLSVCRLEPRKDLGTVLDAWERLRPTGTRLLLAGKAGWKVAPLVERARSIPGVELLGEVDDKVLAGLYGSASAFVTASREEGFGLPVLEAMALGAPVVASAIPPHREVADDAARWFEPGDPDGLATALGEVLSGDGDALRSAGAARAAHWSSDRLAARLLAALDAAAGS